MKKIIKPSTKEESVYYSDFSGKCFGEAEPAVTLKLSFGYGSKYDGSSLELHLSDEDIIPVINIIKNHTSTDFNQKLKQTLDTYNNNYDDHVACRDWYGCDSIGNSIDFLNDLLNK